MSPKVTKPAVPFTAFLRKKIVNVHGTQKKNDSLSDIFTFLQHPKKSIQLYRKFFPTSSN